jgi:dual specificity tyrosine-phosphorylation-regulated kinase 2/3/4
MIDMWSFGCMMYELYIGYPLFPSESEAELLHSIMEVKNIPPKYLIDKGRRKHLFFEDDYSLKEFKFPKGRTYTPGIRELKQLLSSCEDETFLDFVEVSCYSNCRDA